MRKAYWFCPENDIALGRGCIRFTPPRQAALLATYGAPLMWWLGDETDLVIVPECDVEYAERLAMWHVEMEKRFGKGPEIVTSIEGRVVDLLCPWGWSSYSVNRFHGFGADESLTAYVRSNIESIRMLSHRRSASVINNALCEAVDFPKFGQLNPEAAIEAVTEDDVRQFAAKCNDFYVKSPWSSSGRGVAYSGSVSFSKLLERCIGIQRSQGSVMLERAHSKVVDFAMLFEVMCGGVVQPCGYSLFFNERNIAYGGNMIASDYEIRSRIGEYISVDLIDAVNNALIKILGTLIGDKYEGVLGVDMMIASNGSAYYLVPCVELNLRNTMGHVAHAVYQRTGLTGVMKITPAGVAALSSFNLVPQNGFFNIDFA